MSDEAMPEFEEQPVAEEPVVESPEPSAQSPEPAAEESPDPSPEIPDPSAESPDPSPEIPDPSPESPDPSPEIPDPVPDPILPDLPPEEEPAVPDIPDPAEDLAEHLLDVDVRLWAELGRAELPLAEAVALGTGAIVDLDREPSEPLDVFVNGMRFATATLLLVDGEWAIRLEEVHASSDLVEQLSSSGSGA
jgi:flagellar motor switch protein FliN